MASFLPGFLLSLSLIMAIGAQNAFVLRQGLRRAHVFWVCLTCALCDAILIVFGIAGFGALAVAVPWFEPVMRYGGAAFLLWYGWRNARSAWQGGATLVPDGNGAQPLRDASCQRRGDTLDLQVAEQPVEGGGRPQQLVDVRAV